VKGPAAGAPQHPVLSVVSQEPPAPALPHDEAARVDLWWAAAMIGALGAVFLLIAVFPGVAVPVLLSLTLAYVLHPAVSALERSGLQRTWASAAVFALAGLVLVAFVLYLIPALRAEAAKLPELFRRASTQLIPRVEAVTGLSMPELLRQRTTELGAEASELLKDVGPAAAKLLARFAGNTLQLLATLVGLLVVPVIGFFFLRDYPALLQLGRSLLPRRAVAQLSARFAQVDQVLSAFVVGQLSVGAILSVLYSAGLAIARVDLAIVIGLVAGFGNMVPYVGTALGVVLASLALVISWQGPWQIAVVAGTFVGAQLLEGLVITPKVVGDRLGLSSVSVILAVLAFGELFGFTGVLLALPAAAVLKVVLQVALERYRASRWFAGEASPK
jgi:predicted PurR-regulated permease PerM